MHKIVNLVNKTFNSYNATSDIFACPRVAQEMSLKSFKEVGLKLNSIFQTMSVECRGHFPPKYSQNKTHKDDYSEIRFNANMASL